MRTITSLACVSVLALLAACAPTDGYYDNQGNYISYGRNDQRTDYNPNQYPDETRRIVSGTRAVPVTTSVPVTTTTTVGGAPYGTPYGAPAYTYTQRGYYDYQGAYLTQSPGVSVPQSMYPAAGMCRVWFPDRALSSQPPIEPCVGVQTRVPAGAYVIYGG